MHNNLLQKRVMKNYMARRVNVYRRHDVELMARMGNLITNELEVPDTNNCIYVTLEGSGQVFKAINQAVPIVLGAPVWVGYTIDAPISMKVLRHWSYGENDDQNIINGGVPNHQLQHQWFNTDWLPIWGEQFMPMLPTPDGLKVVVYPGNYRINGGWKRFLVPTSIDLTSYVPSTAGKAKIVLIVLTAAGAFAVRDGSEVTGYDALTDGDIPEPTEGDRVICGVILFAGQTAIRKDSANNDFIDARFAGGGGGNVYGNATVTDGHLAVFDVDGYHIKDGGAVPGGGGGSEDYILIRDQKSPNVGGGSFGSGAWRTRDINTIVSDSGSHCSLPGANVIRLEAGTYRYHISAPAWSVARHKARLYDVTGSAMVVGGEGSSEFAYSDAGTMWSSTRSEISGTFTISATNDFRVEHQCQISNTGGFGIEANMGIDEIYTVVEFWRVA